MATAAERAAKAVDEIDARWEELSPDDRIVIPEEAAIITAAIEEAERAARADEREACAKLAEAIRTTAGPGDGQIPAVFNMACVSVATAIRERSATDLASAPDARDT